MTKSHFVASANSVTPAQAAVSVASTAFASVAVSAQVAATSVAVSMQVAGGVLCPPRKMGAAAGPAPSVAPLVSSVTSHAMFWP